MNKLTDEYELKKMDDLCYFIRGVTFSKSDVTKKPKDNFSPVLRAGNISNELILDKDLIYIPNNVISKNQFLIQNDIAICLSSGSANLVGKSAQLKSKFKGTVGAFCGIIRPKSEKYSGFIFLWLKSEEFITWRNDQSRGANIQNLKFSDLKNINIKIPKNLNHLKKVVDESKKKIELVEFIKISVEKQKDVIYKIQSTVLQDNFPYNEGDKLPDGWNWTRIGEIINEIKSGLACGDKSKLNGHPHLRMNNISNNQSIDLSLLWRIPATDNDVEKYTVKQNDILFNNTNSKALVGKCSLFDLDSEEKYLFSNHLTRIRTNENINPEYLVYFINLLWFKRYFENNCETWVNQSAVRLEDTLFKLEIPIPKDLKIQTDIVNKIKRKIKLQYKINKSIEEKLNAALLMQRTILNDVFLNDKIKNGKK